MVKQNDIAQNTQLQKEEIETIINNLDNWILDTKKLAEVLRHILSMLPNDFQAIEESTEIKNTNIVIDLQQTLADIQEKSFEEKQEIFNKLDNSTDDFVMNEILKEKNWPRRAELLAYFLNIKKNQNLKIEYNNQLNNYIFTGEQWVSMTFMIDNQDKIYFQKYWSDEIYRISYVELKDDDLQLLILFDKIVWECYQSWWIAKSDAPFVVKDADDYGWEYKILFITKKANKLKSLLITNDIKFKIKKCNDVANSHIADILNNLWIHYSK